MEPYLFIAFTLTCNVTHIVEIFQCAIRQWLFYVHTPQVQITPLNMQTYDKNVTEKNGTNKVFIFKIIV